MKAEIKDTKGVIIDINQYVEVIDGVWFEGYIDANGKIYDKDQLIVESDILNKIRYKISALAMTSLIRNFPGSKPDWVAEKAIEYSDELIKRLNKGEE